MQLKTLALDVKLAFTTLGRACGFPVNLARITDMAVRSGIRPREMEATLALMSQTFKAADDRGRENLCNAGRAFAAELGLN